MLHERERTLKDVTYSKCVSSGHVFTRGCVRVECFCCVSILGKWRYNVLCSSCKNSIEPCGERLKKIKTKSRNKLLNRTFSRFHEKQKNGIQS